MGGQGRQRSSQKTIYIKKVVRYQGKWHKQKWAQCGRRTEAEIDFQVTLGWRMENETRKPLRETNRIINF